MRDFVTLRVTGTENKKRLFECRDSSSESGHRLLVTVASTHAGIINGNLRFYRPDRMQDGAHTWCLKGRPAKPVLVRHDLESDPLGRVATARYVDESFKYVQGYPDIKRTLFYDSTSRRMDLYKSIDWIVDRLQARSDYSGLGFIELGLSITEPGAIRKIQDDEYLTVSVGFSTDSAICSACHTDWAIDEKCEHRLGSKVNGKQVYLISGNFEYEEVSFVNGAADPFASVTNKQVAAAVKDSLATRAYFLGLSLHDQQDRLGAHYQDSLEDLGIESDITLLVEETMDTKTLQQITSEMKSDSLTKDQALELRELLEKFAAADAKEETKVKRALSGLKAIIKSHDWTAAAETVTARQVQAKIDGLVGHLATLTQDEQGEYVAQLETEASAFGLEFTPPNLDAAETPNPGQAEDAAAGAALETDAAAPAEDASEADFRTLVTDLFSKEAAYFDALNVQAKDAKKEEAKIDHTQVLGALETLHKAYHGTPEQHRHLVRYATSAMLEHWNSGGMLDYYKNRIAEEGKDHVVVSRVEHDALLASLDKFETDAQALSDTNATLLETNKSLARKQKVQMATNLVLIAALTDSAYAAKTAEDLQAEIDTKSTRTLISLTDALTDAQEKLPAALQKATSGKPPEVVKEVSDNARITDATAPKDGVAAEEPPASGDGSPSLPMNGLMSLRERRTALASFAYEQAKNGK